MTSDVLVVPGTGEVLDLRTLTKDQLINVRAGLGDLAAELASARATVNLEITRRIDHENATSGSGYTWHGAGYKVTVSSPTAGGALNAEGLRLDLIREHPTDIDHEALFLRKTSYTLRRDRWHALIKQRPDLDDLRVRNTAPASGRTVTIVADRFAQAVINATAEDA
jgi:hypothetical protein